MPAGTLDPATALTPYRESSLVFDFPEPEIQRLPYTISRVGNEIQPGNADDLGASQGVTLLPSGWWTCKSYQHSELFEQNEVQAGIIRLGGAGVVNVGLFNVVPGVTEHPMWRKPSELPGLTFAGNVAASGNFFLLKGVTAAGDWSSTIPYGSGSDTPPPPLGGSSIPMSRIAVGDTTHNENAGYSFRFQVPQHLAGSPDILSTTTFGGPIDTWGRDGAALSAGDQGGRHAMQLYGNGDLSFWEYVKQNWRKVFDWNFIARGQVGRGTHHLIVQPQGHGNFSFVAAGTRAAHPASPVAANSPQPRPIPIYQAVYHPNPIVTGYSTKRNATGPGNVKVDHRQDLRMYFQVSRLVFPTGTIVDHPFHCAFKLPASPTATDDIQLTLYYQDGTNGGPTGTTVTAVVKDATTHATLMSDGAPAGAGPNQSFWRPNAGQQSYYVVITLNPSSDGFRAPFFKGFYVLVNGIRIDFPPDMSFAGAARSYSITTADLDPTHETASFDMADVANEFEVLRTRSRVPIQARTEYDPNDSTKYSILFQGETALTHAEKRGRARKPGLNQDPARADTLYPSASWRDLSVAAVGMASRVADRLSMGGIPLGEGDLENPGTVDAQGNPQLPRISFVIDYLFNILGYPDDMRDVPDIPARLTVNPDEDGSLLYVQPTANVIEFIIHLARKHLGGYIVFDPNAGLRGMWRLRLPPEPPYTPLWKFTVSPPKPMAARLFYRLSPPGVQQPYGDTGTTFIRRLKTWVAPPEGNYLIVTSSGELYPAHEGMNISTIILWNPNSFNLPGLTTADRNGPDYIGHMVPIIYFEPQITRLGGGDRGNEGMIQIARRIYSQSCVSQKWAEFDAPLVLVTDPSDPNQMRPRPLRLYDPIQIVDPQKNVTLDAVVRSATYNWKSDRAQMMTVQAIIPADANSGKVRTI